MNEELYYIVPKELMDKLKSQFKNNLDALRNGQITSETDSLINNNLGRITTINLLTQNKDCKLIDLSDKAIEGKAREFYWKRNSNKIIAENTRPDMVIGYFQALKDLKN